MYAADVPGQHKKRGRHFRTEQSKTADPMSCSAEQPATQPPSIHRELQSNSPSYSAQLSSRLLINRGAPVSVQNTMVDPCDEETNNAGKAEESRT